MAFDGLYLRQCQGFNFGRVASIIVSGSGPNFCGHALLHVDGHYFHIAGVNDFPKYMPEAGYQRYLRENDKEELGRYFKHLPDRTAAQVKLNQLMAEKWLWGALPHNCITFVEQVMQAGGNTNFGSISNCPTLQISKESWNRDIEQVRRQINVSDEALIQYFSRPWGY